MLSKNNKIQDIILDILSEGQTSTLDLITIVQTKRPKTTKQSIYKTLKILKINETIILNREEVGLSSLWIKKLISFTEKAELNYKQSTSPSINFLRLQQGEKISYSFKTFEDTDRFWVHTFDVLSDTTLHSSPVLIYNPHEWFLLARTESELFLFDRLKKISRKLFSLVGNQDPMDQYIKKYFDGENLKYHMLDSLLYKSKYNVNVFDDFIIEVYLDQDITDEIDRVYKENKIFNTEVKNELISIIKKKGKNKLVISRNKRKADSIRKRFKKYFLF